MSVKEEIIEKERKPPERKVLTLLEWAGVSPRHIQVYTDSGDEWIINRNDSYYEAELMPEDEFESFRTCIVESNQTEFDIKTETHRISSEEIDDLLKENQFTYRPWRDKWLLQHLKYRFHYSNEIADILNCGRTTVQEWCRRYAISYPWCDKSLMYELYVEEGLNNVEIARYLDCEAGTISKWLSEHGIKDQRTNSSIDLERLRSLYVDQHLSLAEIGRRLDCSAGKVRYWIEKHELERSEITRTPSVKYQSHKGYPCWLPDTEGSAVRIRVHRLAAVAKWGLEEIKGMSIHHQSGIPWDNRLSNLELMTNEGHAKQHNSNYE